MWDQVVKKRIAAIDKESFLFKGAKKARAEDKKLEAKNQALRHRLEDAYNQGEEEEIARILKEEGLEGKYEETLGTIQAGLTGGTVGTASNGGGGEMVPVPAKEDSGKSKSRGKGTSRETGIGDFNAKKFDDIVKKGDEQDMEEKLQAYKDQVKQQFRGAFDMQPVGTPSASGRGLVDPSAPMPSPAEWMRQQGIPISYGPHQQSHYDRGDGDY